MKKKIIITAAVFCLLLTALWIIGRFTGMLQFYKTPTPSSEPNIKQGEKFFSSNLLTPSPYNFIVFTSKYEDSVNMAFMPDFKLGTRYIHRLSGVPGDIIEMKNGTLYVNDKNFDKRLNLNIQYKISNAKLALIDQDDINTMEKSGGIIMLDRDSALVTFDNVLMKKYASATNPVLYILHHFDAGPFKWNNKDEQWTVDNFGPIKIPADCYFVVGDNRHNAMDSRYTGFVKKENITGVVLNK